jgi:NifU-like protein involved in Fe-S cluster formation
MFDDIYNRKILELAANIPRLGRLPAPQASASAYSRLCGSSITIDLSLSEGRVSDYAQDVKACALGQAASSVMGQNIIGAAPEELRALRETMRKMLKESGPPPQGRFADAGVLEPARDYKARHASILLVFDAVAEALDKIEKGVAA